MNPKLKFPQSAQAKAKHQLQMLIDDCRIEETRGIRVLEIGSKNACFLEECSRSGIEAIGTDINSTHVERMKAAFPHLTILRNEEDTLPVPTGSFDYVVSFQVLEHMSQLFPMLKECVRVLKPGGYMYHVCPNYRSFYEGHYRVIWLPFLRKKSGSLYLRLIGRDPTGLKKGVFPVTPERLRTMIGNRNGVELISLGRSEFTKRFEADQVSKIKVKITRGFFNLIRRNKAVTSVVLWCISVTGLYYPLTVIARKKRVIESTSS